jgi:copper ion binding protein
MGVHHQNMARATLDLQVEGMSCAACVRAIERKLSRVAGVASVQVDLETGKATVEYDDARAKADQLIGAVEQIGYHAVRKPASAA